MLCGVIQLNCARKRCKTDLIYSEEVVVCPKYEENVDLKQRVKHGRQKLGGGHAENQIPDKNGVTGNNPVTDSGESCAKNYSKRYSIQAVYGKGEGSSFGCSHPKWGYD